MDLSKLPKLSKTGELQPPPDSSAPDPAAPMPSPNVPTYAALAPSSIGFAEAWISIGLGLILLMIFPNTISYLHSPTLFEQNHTQTDGQGNPLTYPHSVFFWTDLGITVFAAALILEGIALVAIRKIAPLWIAFAVTTAATIFNIGVIIHAMPLMDGFPLVNGIGVVVLGYMAMTQWRLISALRPKFIPQK